MLLVSHTCKWTVPLAFNVLGWLNLLAPSDKVNQNNAPKVAANVQALVVSIEHVDCTSLLPGLEV